MNEFLGQKKIQKNLKKSKKNSRASFRVCAVVVCLFKSIIIIITQVGTRPIDGLFQSGNPVNNQPPTAFIIGQKRRDREKERVPTATGHQFNCWSNSLNMNSTNQMKRRLRKSFALSILYISGSFHLLQHANYYQEGLDWPKLSGYHKTPRLG